MQQFVNHGVSFKKAIYDQARQEFCEHSSLYFWFTVLRKFLIYEQNVEKSSDFKKAVSSMITILERNLNCIDNLKLLPQTTRLVLAVEKDNQELVKSLLEANPQANEFLQDLILIPGKFFPFESSYHSCVSASPIGE